MSKTLAVEKRKRGIRKLSIFSNSSSSEEINEIERTILIEEENKKKLVFQVLRVDLKELYLDSQEISKEALTKFTEFIISEKLYYKDYFFFTYFEVEEVLEAMYPPQIMHKWLLRKQKTELVVPDDLDCRSVRSDMTKFRELKYPSIIQFDKIDFDNLSIKDDISHSESRAVDTDNIKTSSNINKNISPSNRLEVSNKKMKNKDSNSGENDLNHSSDAGSMSESEYCENDD